MVIAGVGTDVVELERVRAVFRRQGQRFAERVLSPGERLRMADWPVDRQVEYLAGRFAAKEAMAKAAGCGLAGLGMTSVEIVPCPTGLTVRWLDELPVRHKEGHWHVSITHSRTVAFAVAVWELLDPPAERDVSGCAGPLK